MKYLLICLTLLTAYPLHGDSRYKVFRRCVQCQNQCRFEYRVGSKQNECIKQCFIMKSMDCEQNGLGPGPMLTCDCT